MNILLIQGGWSSEREVALNGASVVKAALENLGHKVHEFDPAKEFASLPAAVQGKDFAFIMLHGAPGEDGLLQAMLSRLNIPYQGTDAAGSMLALDKSVAKTFFAHKNLPTAPWHLLVKKPAADWLPDFDFPVFIKANTGGSSLHMEKVQKAADLPEVLENLFSVASSFIVEKAVVGQELTCGVLGELVEGKEVPFALPPILIKAKAASGIFDYVSKYAVGGAEEICPAPLQEEILQKVQKIALEAHLALGLSGYSRADFILQENGEPILLEVNTLPGMTKTSLLPKEAKAIGMSFEALVARLIELGMAKHGSK